MSKHAVDYATTIPDTGPDGGALSAVALRAVPAGTHTVELRCHEGSALGNDVTVERAGMTVTGHLYPSR